MKTKKQNLKIVTRVVRAREKVALKHGVEITKEKMLGGVARRSWGSGVVADSYKELQ